jgi:hypothetical protein
MDQIIEVESNIREDIEAVKKILKYINKPGHLGLLAMLLDDLDQGSRYGEITLVVREGRVKHIRQERSF